ncbi:MAG: YheU family protein [Gammaproteobacteria bacterium]|nr:YheU family protein [Gammaproteobacteria bacterium]
MIEIPYGELSDLALLNLIDEFITRDSSVTDGTLEQKREQILTLLKSGKAYITYDTDSASAHIWTSEELRRMSTRSRECEPRNSQTH